MIENFNKSTEYTRKLFKDDLRFNDIKKYAIDNKVPIITEEVLNFMLFLIKDSGYKRGLEIGTAIAYSTLYLSEYLDMTSIELDSNRYMMAKENISKFNKDIHLINDDALNVIDKLDGKFDFIFIDAAKGQYRKFFDLCYDKLNEGGLIFIDNIMFRSFVCTEDYPKKYKTIVKNLNSFIEYLNDNFTFSLLPFGDGVGLVKKKGEK